MENTSVKLGQRIQPFFFINLGYPESMKGSRVLPKERCSPQINIFRVFKWVLKHEFIFLQDSRSNVTQFRDAGGSNLKRVSIPTPSPYHPITHVPEKMFYNQKAFNKLQSEIQILDLGVKAFRSYHQTTMFLLNQEFWKFKIWALVLLS